MTYVARQKKDVLKGRDNTMRGHSYGDVTLKCGHTAHGEPTVSNPDRWICVTCQSLQPARRRAA